jgi:alkylhydroperoxidase family enzyme
VTNKQLFDLQEASIDPKLYGPPEAAALAFAEAVARDSRSVPDELFLDLREHFDEGEVVEIALVVGLFLYFNAFNNALRVPPTAPSPYVRR